MSTKEDLLLADIADLREQLYRAENPAFNGRLDSWQAACGKARGESESLRNELRELKAENERLEREAKNDLIAYKAVIERQNELRAENAGLRTGYQAYERVNAELKAEVERLGKRVEEEVATAISNELKSEREVFALQSELTKARELLEKAAYRLSDLRQSQISEPIFVFLGATTDRSILCSHCNDKKYVCLDWDGGEWIVCPKCSSVAQSKQSAPAAMAQGE